MGVADPRTETFESLPSLQVWRRFKRGNSACRPLNAPPILIGPQRKGPVFTTGGKK